MHDLGEIFGKSAWQMIEYENEVVVFNVDYDQRECNILVNGDEYRLSRDGVRQWRIGKEGYMHTCVSQWELLAWISDRL
jgi:hypothetical protein